MKANKYLIICFSDNGLSTLPVIEKYLNELEQLKLVTFFAADIPSCKVDESS